MYSIYHFFASLIHHKEILISSGKIRPDQFDTTMFSSYGSKGKFPDIVLRLNQDDSEIQGGELIELKDSDSYGVASFNSTIPTGTKDLTKLLKKTSKMRKDMRKLGEDMEAHPIRNVFYLVRGRQSGNIKACLVHGSFFETIPVAELIRQAFSQVLPEQLISSLDIETSRLLAEILSQQTNFSQRRHVKDASVSIRFRIMTEVNSAGNILQYDEIEDNTLNFVVPSHSPEQDEVERNRLRRALAQIEFEQLSIKRIKHPFNGEFQVFQIPLFD